MSVKLNTGAQMPIVGFGVWKVDKETCADTVYNAIKSGYRLFDCAQDYGNCIQVGNGLKKAFDDGLVKREDLFITSKLWNNYHHPANVEPSLNRILKEMQLEYFDLFLIHFPIAFSFVPFEQKYPTGLYSGNEEKLTFEDVPLIDTWRALEKIYKEGKKVKAIGISNFNGGLITDLLRQASVVPAVLQIEHHPYLQQNQLIQFVQNKGIAVTGYSSFGGTSYLELDNPAAKNSPSLLTHETIVALAKKYNKTTAQVLLRWATQRGICVIPKSNNQTRLMENLISTDFDLTEEDFKTIHELERNLRFNNPWDWAPGEITIFS